MPKAILARQLRVIGRVQGVGFRPFVHRLAQQLGVSGWVQNHGGHVEICIQGNAKQLDEFAQGLTHLAPARARISQITTTPIPVQAQEGFIIRTSHDADTRYAHITPDDATCAECLAEMQDPSQRRYRYPFISCTQCGPRYTLIDRLPYDRHHTRMADFPLCADCQTDYCQPNDRRMHAQTLACPACGPRLSYQQPGLAPIEDNNAALAATVAALRAGLIVAVKGIGGYHLVCSATDPAAVLRLRQRKHRAFKPLALLMPWSGADGLKHVRAYTVGTTAEWAQLTDTSRPIVLMQKRPHTDLASAIAPDLNDIGIMLPYSPLHHLLLADCNAPLVATSANLSGEPVFIDAEHVVSRLSNVADAFLHHNRTILRPADDSVYRCIAGKARPLRLARGVAPIELTLPLTLPYPLLALGGQGKNTVALAWADRVVVSPHLGDISSPHGLQVFEQTLSGLQQLYGITAQHCISDAHPDYNTHRWAQHSGLKHLQVYHHHAHASALAAEHNSAESLLVFTWDGAGYGTDGTLWGGEALLGKPGHWQRVSSMRPFRLPGGDLAARAPWRSALGLCWELGDDRYQPPTDSSLLKHAWQNTLNSPITSAVGRLFDAAAALLGLVQTADYEAHAAMRLEAASTALADTGIDLPLSRNALGVWLCDWAPLVAMLQNPDLSIAARSACFHASLALSIVKQAQQLRNEHLFTAVGLTGGVFQNRLLTEYTHTLLQAAGFTVYIPEHLPSNDAGISFGQIIEVGNRPSITSKVQS